MVPRDNPHGVFFFEPILEKISISRQETLNLNFVLHVKLTEFGHAPGIVGFLFSSERHLKKREKNKQSLLNVFPRKKPPQVFLTRVYAVFIPVGKIDF